MWACSSWVENLNNPIRDRLQVHGHDPSVDYPSKRGDQVFFHKVKTILWSSSFENQLEWCLWQIKPQFGMFCNLQPQEVLIVYKVWCLRWVWRQEGVWGWTPWATYSMEMVTTWGKSSTSRLTYFWSQNVLQENMQVDIEGSELETLPQWIESGILQSVHQLGIELHLSEVHQVQIVLKWNQLNLCSTS